MASRKTIELKFSNHNKTVESNEIVNKPDDSIKRLNFGGLIVDVKNARSKTATVARPQLESQSKSPNELAKLEREKSAEKASHEHRSFFIKNPATPNILVKPARQSGNQCHPTEQIINVPDPKQITAQNDVEAAGLGAKNVEKVKEKPKVAPPKNTAADWEIFKQFMDPLPKAPTHDELVAERNKPELIKNQDEFVCSICELFILKGKGVVVNGCKHQFCRVCLIDCINNNHNAMGEVKCPFPVENCKSFLADEEVKTLLGVDFDQFALKIVQILNNAIRQKERNDEAAKHDADLEAIDNLEFIENVEAFECAICYGDIDVGQGVILKNCRHSFCKECLIESIKHSDEYVVKCPGDECELTVQEREIRGLVPAELFDQHLEKSLKLYEGTTENAYHCKTPDCRGFIEIDKNLQGFMCFVCKRVNCIGCKVIHHGKNCQEYQDTINPDGKNQRENAASEKLIRKMVDDTAAMYCPRCKIPVMKDDGCDFITCLTCKLGICWVTKKPRHPLMKEDGTVIDGCHCKEYGGKMCHPDCRHCH